MFKVMTARARSRASVWLSVCVRVFNAFDREMITILARVIIPFYATFNPFPDIFAAKGISPFNSLRLNVKITCKWFLLY